MPQSARAHGPWGEAIRYWLNVRKLVNADLARMTGIRANTIGRAANGFNVQTRVLEKIAEAFKVPLESVLVSPDRLNDQAQRRQIVIDAVEAALSQHDRQRLIPPTIAALADAAETEMARQDLVAGRTKAAPKRRAKPIHRVLGRKK